MKTDRLLSIIIYLLNHDMASARTLAERHEVSIRTIQRDMESLEQAGIPVFSQQGPDGGYGLVEQFKMDRQLLNSDDFYYILNALQRIEETLADGSTEHTMEKIRSLIPDQGRDLLDERNKKLRIDFSLLGGDPGRKKEFRIIKQAVDTEKLLHFSYISNKLTSSERTIEPMTISFYWYSWYLFGYCLLRNDYRLFRLSRIKNPQILDSSFKRRSVHFEEFIAGTDRPLSGSPMMELTLKFNPLMKPLAEEQFSTESCTELDDGSLIVKTRLPDEGSSYGYILSFGSYVEVLEPVEVRKKLCDAAMQITAIYKE